MRVVSARFLFNRSINQLQCWVSYMLSLLGVYRVHHLPVFVSVEPANYCQLRCPQCPVGMHAPEVERDCKLLEISDFRKILKEVSPYVHTMQFYFQGEPLLNSILPDMIRLAAGEGIYTSVSTNAQALTRERAEALISSGVSKIIVSMDGLTQDTYEQYRVGGSVERTREALTYLREAKNTHKGTKTIIVLQCLRLRSNETEWRDFRRKYRRMGADQMEFKTAQFYDFIEGNPLMPTDAAYSRYQRGADGLYRLKKPMYNHCYRLWSGAVIDVEGNIRPCCYDKIGTYIYGNIYESSLKRIFWGRRAKEFRQRVMSHRADIGICQNCVN